MANNFRVTLKIDGFHDREVSVVDYVFYQASDKENQPSGIPRGGKISVRVKAEDSGNAELLKWATAKSMAKKGSLLFMTAKNIEKKMKSIEFEGAYCLEFREHWEDVPVERDNAVPIAHWEEIVISCRKITNGPVNYENEWK